MIKFILGMIFGIVVTTIGFTGLAKMADQGVSKVQEMSKDAVNSNAVDDIKRTAKKAVDEVTK